MPAEDKNHPIELDFASGPGFDEILTNPILDIAARLWDENRYEAFRICYRSMRLIDDLIDDRKATGEDISPSEAAQFSRMIDDWLEASRSYNSQDKFIRSFIDTRDRFAIPFWPWQRLCQAMIYDLKHDGFKSFTTFLRYAEGAAVAPAAVFMHLCGIKREGERFVAPVYDIRKAARPLAIFSYLVHIIRDFHKDARNNLNYFATSLMQRHSVDTREIHRIASGREVTPSFRRLIAQYRSFAEYYRRLARRTIDEVDQVMAARYRLSLEVVYSLYLQIFERIDPVGGSLSETELMPSPAEVKARLELTIQEFSSQKLVGEDRKKTTP